MSTDQFYRKLDQSRKLINSLKKDLKYRQDQQKRGQATYSLDAQIRGSFTQLDQCTEKVETIFLNFKANPRQFNLSNQQVNKRQQQYQQLSNQRANLKRQFDSYFKKKATTRDLLGQTQQKKKDYSSMNTKDLLSYKQNQQQAQDDAIQDLINEVQDGIDINTKNMGSVKRNMMKLLQQSSNCCLFIIIILEIAAILAIALLW